MNRNDKSWRLFLLLSGVLILVAVGYLGLHYQSAKQALEQSFQRDGQRRQGAYELVYRATLNSLMQIGEMVSRDELVHRQLSAANRAWAEEGGGKGGPRTAALRQTVLNDVAAGWTLLNRDYGIRQMHFHFGPEITTFLRVHKPEKFGDALASIRPIVADAFREDKARTGTEIGLHGFGMRAVLPIHTVAADSKASPLIGTLEIGASFKEVFKTLDSQFDSGFAALLRKEAVARIVAKDASQGLRYLLNDLCQCTVEESSRAVDSILAAYVQKQPNPAEVAEAHKGAETVWIEAAGENLAVTRFGLADYHGLRGQTGQSIGTILTWRNVDREVAAFRASTRNNAVLAVVVFLLLDALLYVVLRAATMRLERLVGARTADLRESNSALAREVDQHAATRGKLDETEQFWATVAENIQSPLMVIGTDYQVKLMNAAARGLGGKTIPAGITCHKLSHHRDTPCNGADDPCPLESVLRTGEPTRVTHLHHDLSGQTHVVDMHAWPLRDASGRITGIIEIGDDVTDMHRTQQALAKSERTMAIAQQLAGLGSWRLDRNGDQITCSAQMLRIVGLPTDVTTFDIKRLRDIIHPDDRAAVRRARQAALDLRKPFNMTYRIQVDGAIKWVHEQAEFDFDAHDRLKSAIGTVLDITDRRLVETALVEAKIQAEAANVAKSAFLANMSHEIRTPLNVITGMAHMIRKTGLNADQATRLGKLESASHHLLGILNAILDLSAIEAGKFELEEQEFSAENLVGNVVSLLQDRAAAKSLRLNSEVAPLLGHLKGDAIRLQQALFNYASNAIKFTEVGHVTLRVSLVEETVADAMLRFEVQDSGVGIATDDLPRLFSAFEQADNSTTRRHGGTGLGLAIAKKIAQLMGGAAGVQSTLGSGSLFWFTARVKKVRAKNEAASAVQAQDQGAALSRNRSDLTAPTLLAPVEWNALRQQLLTLRGRLAVADMTSARLAHEIYPALHGALGEQASRIGQCIESFEFDLAIEALDTLMAQEPRLRSNDESTKC